MSTPETTISKLWRLLTVRSLFAKIFLWFWLAMLAVSLTLFFVVWVTPPDFSKLMPYRLLHGVQGIALVDAYEQNGRKGLEEMIKNHPISHFETSYLFSESGRELLDKSVSQAIIEAVRLSLEKMQMVEAFDDLGRFRTRIVLSDKGTRYVLVSRRRADQGKGMGGASRGGWWRGKGQARPLGRILHFLTFGDLSSMAFRLIAIIATTFILCYGLARYLTRPIVRLQVAAHQLAIGQLGFRIEHEMQGRQDELADLAHDFDVMAGRIEGLLATQRRLLGDISHELRTPLTRMSVSLELAREDADEALNEHLNSIEREAQRLQELISRVVTLVRLDSPDAHFQRSGVDLAELIDEVAADAELEARTKSVNISCTCDMNCVVYGSRELLRRAVENIVRNAIRHSPEKGTIEVKLERIGEDPQKVGRLVVRDHGAGVQEDQLLKLFEPFYRCEVGRERKTGGVGLGLSITERAISFHSGSVIAENAEDGGLRIIIDLPLSSGQALTRSGLYQLPDNEPEQH